MNIISDNQINEWIQERFDHITISSWSDDEYSYYSNCARNHIQKMKDLKKEWNEEYAHLKSLRIQQNNINSLIQTIDSLSNFLGYGCYEEEYKEIEEIALEKDNNNNQIEWLKSQQL